jgi:hypothetical protein
LPRIVVPGLFVAVEAERDPIIVVAGAAIGLGYDVCCLDVGSALLQA